MRSHHWYMYVHSQEGVQENVPMLLIFPAIVYMYMYSRFLPRVILQGHLLTLYAVPQSWWLHWIDHLLRWRVQIYILHYLTETSSQTEWKISVLHTPVRGGRGRGERRERERMGKGRGGRGERRMGGEGEEGEGREEKERGGEEGERRMNNKYAIAKATCTCTCVDHTVLHTFVCPETTRNEKL